jgi:hypothetical protein
VPGSTSKTWAKQQAVVSSDELTPGVCEMTLAIILHYLQTGERLHLTVYVRTGGRGFQPSPRSRQALAKIVSGSLS